MGEGNAGDDRLVNGSHAAIVFRHLINDKVDCGRIAVGYSTAERENEQFFGQAAIKILFSFIGQNTGQFVYARKSFARHQFARRIYRLIRFSFTTTKSRPSFFHIPPLSDSIEVLHSQAEWIHALMARGAGRIATVELENLAKGRIF